jgi:histidinol dehydrogenase
VKVLRGFDNARDHLSRRRALDLDNPPIETSMRGTHLFGEPLPVDEVVRRILRDVREEGDIALDRFAQFFEGTAPSSLEVSWETIVKARETVSPDLIAAMEHAAERIYSFHQSSLPKGWIDSEKGYGIKITPIERVGIYVPGGTAAYPSTVLMTAIPARVAGVAEIIVTTPGKDGLGPDPTVLAACHMAGVNRVYQVGGAQAIAAMSYGTNSIPRVDMVCGPGNIYVTFAKKQVYGHVAVDGLYGPTETIIIADRQADPTFCAADLLAQAEHDSLSTPILITDSEDLLLKVQHALDFQLTTLERASIAKTALTNQGCLIVVDDLDRAFDLANLFAPEHLCLLVNDPWSYLDKIRNAGGVFLGETTPEALGDYVAGPSHVMPTGGTARFSSPLGVNQFLKLTSIVGFSRNLLEELAETTSTIARFEQLTGHAKSVEARLDNTGSRSD